MIERVAYVRIFVSDLDRAVDFYTNVLGLKLSLCDDSFGWAQFDIQGPVLALERIEEDDLEFRDLVGRFSGVSLFVKNFEDCHGELLERGVKLAGPPRTSGWIGTLAHVHDPDGNVTTFVQAEITS